ncbi:MAG: cation transporter [Zoogloeaceae bacterium]|nr:cation transporter [Zoogloeaceae bacterium]MCK6385362.1 heavy-metal-associated domain-containing protein [Rhodocyclaceae bacterium]
MTRIVASIPGRIRVRDGGLRHDGRLARLRAVFLALDGVHTVEGNPHAGSIVVRYNAARHPPEVMEEAVERAVEAELAHPISRVPPSRRVRINRAAKYGMLASLGTSLVLAAVGNKRWHAATGLLFVACLGVHLGVHRRHILR